MSKIKAKTTEHIQFALVHKETWAPVFLGCEYDVPITTASLSELIAIAAEQADQDESTFLEQLKAENAEIFEEPVEIIGQVVKSYSLSKGELTLVSLGGDTIP